MLVGTPSDRILEALRRSSHPLDDDQLSERTEIGSWHQVNRLCRNLERSGRLRRMVGPDQRVVNEFVAPAFSGVALDSGEPAALGAVLGSPELSVLAAARPPEPIEFDATAAASGTLPPPAARFGSRPAGSQFPAPDPKRLMLDHLGARLGVTLTPVTISATTVAPAVVAPSAVAVVEIDGADVARSVLVECWTDGGPAHDVLADALKLSWIAGTIDPRPRLVLCFGSRSAAEPFRSQTGSWAAHALRDLGITVEVVEIP